MSDLHNSAISPELQVKYKKLEEIIRSLGSVAVAYSGGVDSTFLAAVSAKVLDSSALAITAVSETYPSFEREEATRIAAELNIAHKLIETSELNIPGFSDNPPERCYFCKKELFETLLRIAKEEGLSCVVEGTNIDDKSDYRPGRRAIEELGVYSPLFEAGFTKEDIRIISKNMSLPTWNKPAYACLASRFPYGEPITATGLTRVEKAEGYLRELGVKVFRVRSHGDIARIELGADDFPLIIKKRIEVSRYIRELGFAYVSLDLEGYRTGSLNEVLPQKKH